MLQLVCQRSLFSNVRTLLLPVSLIRPYQYLPYFCHSVDFGTWTAILCTFLTVPSKKAPEKEPNDIAPLLSNKHDTLFQNSLSSRTKNSFAVVVNIYLAFFHIKSGNICERFSPLTSSNMNKVIMTTCNFPSEFLALSDYAQRHQC